MEYSIVENNVVTNIVISDSPFAENWYEGNHGIGSVYDPITNTFSKPAPPAPPVIKTISKLAYMNRFSESELIGIYTAAKSVVSVEIWLEKFKLAEEISLDNPELLAGLQAMETAGLLTAGRSTEIVAFSTPA